MNNNPFADILSGIVGVCITCLFNHFSHQHKLHSHKLKITINSVSQIEQISSDFNSFYSNPQISTKDKFHNSYNLTQLNLISLYVLSKNLDAHVIYSLARSDCNWILDYLQVSNQNDLLGKHKFVLYNYEKAYKKIFKFHRKDDKYEISTK